MQAYFVRYTIKNSNGYAHEMRIDAKDAKWAKKKIETKLSRTAGHKVSISVEEISVIGYY